MTQAYAATIADPLAYDDDEDQTRAITAADGSAEAAYAAICKAVWGWGRAEMDETPWSAEQTPEGWHLLIGDRNPAIAILTIA